MADANHDGLEAPLARHKEKKPSSPQRTPSSPPIPPRHIAGAVASLA